MPTWIVTQIELTGTREILEEIKGAINQCNDGPDPDNHSDKNWVGNILDMLHINTKKWNPYKVFWNHAHFNKHGHLVFVEYSAESRSKCAEALKQKFPHEISGINYHYLGWC